MDTIARRRTLPDYLEITAACHANAVALMEGDRRVSYAELRARALHEATRLWDEGVRRGDRVVLIVPNCIEFVVAFWAVEYLGAVAVPLNPDIRFPKIRWILRDCSPSAVIVHPSTSSCVERAGVRPALRLLDSGVCGGTLTNTVAPFALNGNARRVPIDQDLACIIYTSGSTGTPKGVMLSHLNMVAASLAVSEYLEMVSEDRVFCAIPFSFDYGLHQITMTTLVGAALIVEESFAQPLFSLHRLVKLGATVFPIVPTMASLIEPLARRFDFGRVRSITSTAAVLHPGAIDRLQQIFPGARMFSMYGLTECHRCTYLDPNQLPRRKSSVGKAIPNTELWVVDEEGKRHDRSATGELVIRGSTVMRGYWNNPGETNEKLRPGPLPGEVVLYTGDVCRLDDEGFVYFIRRKDDVLKVKGQKVAPKEVEDALVEHPEVMEAAVIGVPDRALGDEVIAFVSRREGSTTDSPTLRAWCAAHLEAVMVPSRVTVLDTLPKTANGKIDKLALKECARSENRVLQRA
jgi:amino acid adenylation domain-containing protein